MLAVIALSVGAMVALIPAAPAGASCAETTATELRERADAVAVGTVTAVYQPFRIVRSSSDPVHYNVSVDVVYSGTVQESIIVTAPAGYGLDGTPVEGREYLLFLTGSTPEFTADACTSMPMPLTVPGVADEVAGWQGTEPESGGAAVAGSGNGSWIVIGLGALVLGGILLLVRDRRRRALARRT